MSFQIKKNTGSVVLLLLLSCFHLSFFAACASRIPMKESGIELANEKKVSPATLPGFLTGQLALISEKYFVDKTKETIQVAVLPFRTDKEDTTVLTQAITDTISKDLARRIQFKIPDAALLETATDKFQIYQVGWSDSDVLTELGKFLSVDIFLMGTVKEASVAGSPFFQIEMIAKSAIDGQTVLSNSSVISKKQLFSDLNFTEIAGKTLVEKEGYHKGSIRIIYRADDPLSRFQSTPQKLLTKFYYSYEQFTASKSNPHELIAVDSSCSIDGISKVPDSDGFCLARTLRTGTYKLTFSYLLKQLVSEVYEEVGTIRKTFSIDIEKNDKVSLLIQNTPETTPPSISIKAWKTITRTLDDGTLDEEKVSIKATPVDSSEN
jgi:hypothetical protein